jgi:hypothetical protein
MAHDYRSSTATNATYPNAHGYSQTSQNYRASCLGASVHRIPVMAVYW